MNENPAIEHQGFIERITDNSVFVRILSRSACSECHAKGGCSLSGMEEKEVEVTSQQGNFTVGETVILVMKQSLGYSAILIAYIYPFLLVLLILFATTASGLDELSSGLLSLSILLPYYLTISLIKNKLRKKFTFSIRKTD